MECIKGIRPHLNPSKEKTVTSAPVSNDVDISGGLLLTAVGPISLFPVARRKVGDKLRGVLNSDRAIMVDTKNILLSSARFVAGEIPILGNGKVSVFVANAVVDGGENLSLTATGDGYEQTFATNHSNDFILF